MAWIEARRRRLAIEATTKKRRIDRARRKKPLAKLVQTGPGTGDPGRDYYRSWKEYADRDTRRREQGRERQRRYRERQRALNPYLVQRSAEYHQQARRLFSMDYAKAAAERLELPPGFPVLITGALREDDVLAAWEFFLRGYVKE